MQENIKQAILARSRAYTPYSNFQVGAAILLKDGTYVLGANIENGAYPLSNCAERSAIFSLMSQGYDREDIVSITVIADDKGPVSPCGACRQVMHELLPKGTPIILANMQGETMTTDPDGLLPYAFELDQTNHGT